MTTQEQSSEVKRYRGQRGAQRAPTKQLVTLRLDADILDYLRATGDGWQTRLNAELRKLVKRARR